MYDAYGLITFLNANYTAGSATSYGWSHFYAGYYRDLRSGMYQVRNRAYHPQFSTRLQFKRNSFVQFLSTEGVIAAVADAPDPITLVRRHREPLGELIDAGIVNRQVHNDVVARAVEDESAGIGLVASGRSAAKKTTCRANGQCGW